MDRGEGREGDRKRGGIRSERGAEGKERYREREEGRDDPSIE